MNLYFLTEDSKSFRKVLPKWLSYILPHFHEESSFDSLKSPGNHYMIQDGKGYPGIRNRVAETVETLAVKNVPLDQFIVCWDGDARGGGHIREDKAAFAALLERNNVNYPYRFFVMRHCFETWLLGNRAVYPRDGLSEAFAPYAAFYDVSADDPEKMLRPRGYAASVSQYHYHYLQEMLRNSIHKNYSKGSPGVAKEKAYWDELCQRTRQTPDLRSFADFLDFLRECRIQSYEGDARDGTVHQ